MGPKGGKSRPRLPSHGICIRVPSISPWSRARVPSLSLFVVSSSAVVLSGCGRFAFGLRPAALERPDRSEEGPKRLRAPAAAHRAARCPLPCERAAFLDPLPWPKRSVKLKEGRRERQTELRAGDGRKTSDTRPGERPRKGAPQQQSTPLPSFSYSLPLSLASTPAGYMSSSSSSWRARSSGPGGLAVGVGVSSGGLMRTRLLQLPREISSVQWSLLWVKERRSSQ